MKRGGGGKKGGKYEKEICEKLSLWWGKQDDIFYKTHGSGSRATVRSKLGKETRGMHGDVGAVDGRGRKFTKICIVSIKRGYSDTIANLFDQPPLNTENQMQTWIREAETSHQLAKSISWMIILRRDRRRAVVVMPIEFYCSLAGLGGVDFNMISYKIQPYGIIRASVYQKLYKQTQLRKMALKKKRPRSEMHQLLICDLDKFLATYDKSYYKALLPKKQNA